MFFLQMLQLLEPFSSAEALAIVKHVMEEQEVNWRSVLTVTSVLLTTFEEASSMLQGLLNRINNNVFLFNVFFPSDSVFHVPDLVLFC